jgi:hypothetical protein
MMRFETVRLNKKNITDFAKERNILLRKSKSEWMFFLDTDEIMSAEFKKEIRNLNPGNIKGFYIFRQNFFKDIPLGTDKILRLGKRTSGKWVRRVHEIWAIPGEIGELKNPVIHNSANNLHEFIDKVNFYSTLHAEENLKNRNHSNLFKIVVYPVGMFFQSLINGRGFVFSMLQSFHSFLAWSKEWKLQNA